MTKKKLILTGTCLNTGKAVYFSYEKYPNMRVLDALRITISVPILFDPVKFNDRYYVDGGCIDNYPISLFNDELENVIGIHLGDQPKKNEICNVVDYFISIFNCLQQFHCKNSYKGYEKYTLNVCSNNNSSLTNFEIDKQMLLDMFKDGAIAMTNFLNNYES